MLSLANIKLHTPVRDEFAPFARSRIIIMQHFAAAAAAGGARPRVAPETAGERFPPAAENAAWGSVPPAYYAAQHALVAAPQHAAAWGAVPPAPQHALVAAPYGFAPVAAPPPPYPAVAPDNALTALERALAPKVEPTPAFLELERWVEAHVANVGRRRSCLLYTSPSPRDRG